jgi:hypothetical protein
MSNWVNPLRLDPITAVVSTAAGAAAGALFGDTGGVIVVSKHSQTTAYLSRNMFRLVMLNVLGCFGRRRIGCSAHQHR